MPTELSIIDRHTLAIESTLKKPTNVIIETLAQESFWINLLDNNKEIYEYWKKIEPLVHLNTARLLSLLEEHVLPLERAYEYLSMNLGKITQEQVAANQLRLSQLKSQIFEALLLRAQAHKRINYPRQFDDVLTVVVQSINQLGVHPKIPKPNEISYSLDDDRRLTIFEYLLGKYKEDDLIQHVTIVIPKREHRYRQDVDKAKIKLQKLHHFRQTLHQQLRPQRSLFKVLQEINNTFDQFITPLKAKLGFWFIVLQKSRYGIYLGLSLLAYYCVLQSIAPLISIVLGVKALGVVSNILFYTIGLSPLWMWGWQSGANLLARIYERLTRRKTNQIFDGLVLLEDLTHFIHEKLDSQIIDISHFDIAYLESRCQKISADLRMAMLRLEHYTWLEKLFCKNDIRKYTESIFKKLKTSDRKLVAALTKLSNQLANDIKNEIELLEPDETNQAVNTCYPYNQAYLLEHFVRKYGGDAAGNLFRHHSNPVNRWIEKFSLANFAVKKEDSNTVLQIPWGTFSRRDDLLMGWMKIIQSLEPDSSKRDVALMLIEVLRGAKPISKSDFQNCIHNLHLVEQVIQAFIFATLDSKTAQNAALLSENEKSIIRQWRAGKKHSIEQAIRHYNAILQQTTHPCADEELSLWFELLDAEDIYLYSVEAILESSQRRNSVRNAIDAYQGDRSELFRFFRFIPVDERAELITTIAKRRLKWLINNPSSSELCNSDIELFQHPDLNSQTLKLNKRRHYLPTFIELSQNHMLSILKQDSVPLNPKVVLHA
jgi:hypothetical protein